MPNTPVAYRNGPDVTKGLDSEVDAWMRFNVLMGFSTLPELGSRTQRNLGVISVQIFTPKGQGDGRGTAIADSIAELWLSANVTPIILGAHQFEPVGARRESVWWQDNLSTSFFYDHRP